MFWRQTPRETACHLRALSAERQRAYELAIFTAWHAAALSRVERMPDLGPLMDRVSGRGDAEQDPEEQMDAARALAASFSVAPSGQEA